MPIRPPALDDRSFDDLVAELVARIPAHTPEWTNPRLGDPGRTLIELFAWLADTILYRANLIPERQRLAFLRLLGQPLKPALPARGLVALAVEAERDLAAVEAPPGSVIEKPLPFRTLDYATVLPLTGQPYLKRRLTPAERPRFAALLPDLAAAYGLPGEAEGYVTTPVLADGISVELVADSVDRSLWIALMAPTAETLAAARAALAPGLDGGRRAINVGLVPATEIPALDEDVGPRAAIPLEWEVTSGRATGGPLDLVSLEVLGDTSAGLARAGVVRLALPDPRFLGAPPDDPRDNLAAGVGDAPPRLDNPADAARLVAWLRLRPAPSAIVERVALGWAAINAVSVEQREALPPRVLGQSDGGGDQLFDLGTAARGGVDAASLRIEVEEPTGAVRPWTAVDDLGASGPQDPAYQLDPEAGTIRFGDGVHGLAPLAGARVIARGLLVGGGAAGNLPPNSLRALDAVLDPVTGARAKPPLAVKIHQPLPLLGGTDAETLDAAERRIPALLRHRDRAVVGEDYRRLAREAPGAEVGRVALLPRFKPHERRSGVPGVVSVMALPARAAAPGFLPPYPRADRPLLEAVHAFLDARRPLATELYAIGCVYKPLGASVAVQLRDGFTRETVLAGVRHAIRRYLWPLPLGPEGSGGDWPAHGGEDGGYPLGRDLTDRELEVVAARVAGVAGVSPVRLFDVDGEDFRELPGAGKAVTRFTLEPWELPELVALAVVEGVDAPLSPGGRAGPSGPGAIAVPVVPELC